MNLAITGTVRLPVEFDERKLLDHLAQCLIKVNAIDVVIRENRVEFVGGFLRWVDRWNPLLAFRTGQLEVDAPNRCIRYRLQWYELVLVCTLMIAIMGAVMYFSKFPPQMFTDVLPMLWCGAIGVNLLIGYTQFDAFVKESVKSHVAEAGRQGP